MGKLNLRKQVDFERSTKEENILQNVWNYISINKLFIIMNHSIYGKQCTP
jgi:hypothetical protein